MAEPTYDEVLKASLNSKLLLYRQVISSFMIKFLCNVEVNPLSSKHHILQVLKVRCSIQPFRFNAAFKTLNMIKYLLIFVSQKNYMR